MEHILPDDGGDVVVDLDKNLGMAVLLTLLAGIVRRVFVQAETISVYCMNAIVFANKLFVRIFLRRQRALAVYSYCVSPTRPGCEPSGLAMLKHWQLAL